MARLLYAALAAVLAVGGGLAVLVYGTNTPPPALGPTPTLPPTVAATQAAAPSVVATTAPLAAVAPAWRNPLPGKCITSRFGWRNGRIHQGVDLGAPVGTNVLAAAAGVVYWGNQPSGAGWYMMIDHGHGVWTMYDHLSKRLVAPGKHVVAGQHIAESGGAKGAPGAGNSTGPHTHVEVHPWGRWVKHWSASLGAYAYTNPVTWMAARGIRIGC